MLLSIAAISLSWLPIAERLPSNWSILLGSTVDFELDGWATCVVVVLVEGLLSETFDGLVVELRGLELFLEEVLLGMLQCFSIFEILLSRISICSFHDINSFLRVLNCVTVFLTMDVNFSMVEASNWFPLCLLFSGPLLLIPFVLLTGECIELSSESVRDALEAASAYVTCFFSGCEEEEEELVV
ncbi:MAG TPA: hypothetical protein VM660_05645 [Bacillus sp. (in: firmicutes)]|nr:hypothetical protein [Bacillus sp. (in: firmicutes)]